MTNQAAETVNLYLSDINDFFQTPEIDPFAGENIANSGIDQVIDTLNARARREIQLQTIAVHLPEANIDPDLATRLPAAISSYCSAQSRLAAQKKREVRLEGFKALRIGLVFWAICLALSVLFERLFEGGPFARLFGEGFIIAGWVCLWHPAELLLYEWRPYALAMKRYEQIKSMKVRIVPHDLPQQN